MTGVDYRSEANARLRPEATEGLVGGGHIQLVTLELQDTGEDEQGHPIDRPKVRCELRPPEARLLAYTLLSLAERADLLRFEPDPAQRAAARARARAAAHAAAEGSVR